MFIQSFRQADCFPDPIYNGNLTVTMLANDHVKTIGTEVDGSDYLGIDTAFRAIGENLFAAGSYANSPYEELRSAESLYGE